MVLGATLNIDNSSVYIQDHWTVNNQISADIGARYEHVTAVSSGDIFGPKTNRVVPRLGLGYDIASNGDHVVHVTFGQYPRLCGEPGRRQRGRQPGRHLQHLSGTGGPGADFAPGLNATNYPVTPGNCVAVTVPLANVFVNPNTKSALTNEFTASTTA